MVRKSAENQNAFRPAWQGEKVIAVGRWAGGRRKPGRNRCEPVPDKAGNQTDRPMVVLADLREFPVLAGRMGGAGKDGIKNYKDRKPNDS
jgi:hypothetical protein